MRSLIWKEWRENIKWVPLPSALLLGPMLLFGVPVLMDSGFLAYVSLVAALFGIMLGLLQILSEAQTDKRSLLLQRPLSGSRIFLGKAVAGVSLYLLALLAPTSCAVVLAATPGHVAAPFEWPMTLPWLADIFTGLVYYFAAMITAQREARWFGSRCLPLAAGLVASFLVWNLAEFWEASLTIVVFGGVTTLAAWGSFLSGGVYEPQPRLAKVALAVTIFAGLSALLFTAKVTLGLWLAGPFDYPYEIDREGRLFMIYEESGQRITGVTDLQGRPRDEFKGQRVDSYALNQIKTSFGNADPQPRGQSYRNPGRCLLDYKNETTPLHEAWWYVPARGRILGYDKGLKHFLGSFGPDGFAPPGEQPRDRFDGPFCQKSLGYVAKARDPLAFATAAYTVDFHKGTVHRLFTAPVGERIRWASKHLDRVNKWNLCYVGTDKAVYYLDLDQGCKELVAVPLAYDSETEEVNIVGRLTNPEWYWVWYYPQWYRPLHDQAASPEARVVIYDGAGRECQPRQEAAPRPGVARLTPVIYSDMLIEPSEFQALFGVGTSPVEAAVLVGTTAHMEAETRRKPSEVPLFLQNLWLTTQAFIPGVRWDVQARPGLAVNFAALVLLTAVCSAIACYLRPRHWAFSQARRVSWGLCGMLLGPIGLLMMIVLLQRPAQVACPTCRKPRVVGREACEHCGAAHGCPSLDGTEIFEQPAVRPCLALSGQDLVQP